MNTPATTPLRDDDAQLRQHLRDALTQTPAEDLSALESRTLAQWRLRVIDHQTAQNGPLAVIQAGWRHHPVFWRATLLAFGLAAVLLLQPWADSELAMDELMQPDVLSLIAAGEL